MENDKNEFRRQLNDEMWATCKKLPNKLYVSYYDEYGHEFMQAFGRSVDESFQNLQDLLKIVQKHIQEYTNSLIDQLRKNTGKGDSNENTQ